MAELEQPEEPITAYSIEQIKDEREEEVVTTYTWEEVQKHGTSESLWVVVHNKIYDVTRFMNEHPGGEEVLLEHAGEDATEAFEDVGHSPDARELQQSYLIGEIDNSSKKTTMLVNTTPNAPETHSNNWLLPIGILGFAVVVAAVLYRVYFTG